MAKTNNGDIRLNTDTGFLKLLAMVFMVIDHVGVALFPSMRILRLLGRIAFPIYAYCLTVGITHTRSVPRYCLRLAVLAILSQPIYALALHHTNTAMTALAASPMTLQTAFQWYIESWNHPSILPSLLFGVIVLWSLRDKKYIVTAAMVVLLYYIHPHLDYGWKGIVLMALFFLFRDKPLTSLVWVGGFMVYWAINAGSSYAIGPVKFGLQGFMVLALPLIYIPTGTKWKLPKWLFYLFYPGHLAVLYFLEQIL